MMTIGDHPEYLAVGYLLNQNMLRPEDRIIGIDYDDEIETVVVRTERETDFEDKLKKKTLTSGCAQGTVFGDLMEKFEEVRLDPSGGAADLLALCADPQDQHRARASISRPARSMAACCARRTGRCSTWRMSAGTTRSTRSPATCTSNNVSAAGKIFYTTGRLTSEMVIKTVQMGIPILVSRSGFTAWGVELARQAGLTLIGRAKGRRFVALAGSERIVFDGDPRGVADEPPRLARKASLPETRRSMTAEREQSSGLLLAGGLSRRMGGGDKALRPLGGRTAARPCDRPDARRRSPALVLNANGDPARFAAFGLPVVADSVPDFAGPLAGILAGLDWAAAHRPDCPDIVSVPTDAPFLPRDLVARLLRERERPAPTSPAPPRAAGRTRSSGCGRCGCAMSLREAVVAEGIRKVDIWTARHRLRDGADFPEARPGLDPFFNANRPGDLDRAAELLRQTE